MLDEWIKQANKHGETSNSTLISTLTPPDRMPGVAGKTPIMKQPRNNLVKSPSDTTIYVPALERRKQPNDNKRPNLPNNFVSPPGIGHVLILLDRDCSQHDYTNEKVDHFVESVRHETNNRSNE